MSSLEQLAKVVLEKSESKDWDTAVKEWDLVDTNEDIDASSTCVCGKTGLRYLHRILILSIIKTSILSVVAVSNDLIEPT